MSSSDFPKKPGVTEGKSLAVIMPVYNERDCIAESVSSWLSTLTALDVDFVFYILNDGSSDGTERVLEQFQSDARVHVIHKRNEGHGPTIHRGYRLAADSADWVFQTDSDMEIGAEHFKDLWARRDGYDAILGIRVGRQQKAARKIVSALSRISVRCLYAKGVADVNVPYRLMRSNVLKPILALLPRGTFAPNVIISGVLALEGARIFNHPVQHVRRKTGVVSLMQWRLWKSSLLSFWQLVSFRLRYRRLSRASYGHR